MTGSAFTSRIAFLLVLAFLPSVRARTPESAATLILFNKNDPDSAALAKYYQSRRDVPATQMLGLNCALTEEISRDEYEDTIARPLRAELKKQGWWTMGRGPSGKQAVTSTKIRFLALMRGVPLKIRPDPTRTAAHFVADLPEILSSRNDASVDSELCVLALMDPGIGGLMPNPIFNRFTPILGDVVNPSLMVTGRLDGPTPSIVRAMIDDAISTEKNGLWGWAYVDGRGITSGGYAEGDRWMMNLMAMMRTAGIPVIFDNTPPTFPADFPVTQAAVYYGWYADAVNGPFAAPDFQFQPGAVAVHIHSFSASTLRSTTANWCGPLLAHGAAATLGNVYEPYLALTANLDIFQNRLMQGFTLAESGWMAQKALSWMSVVVGDPLYRPYAIWKSSVPSKTGGDWQTYRKLILATNGDFGAAALSLRDAAVASKNSMFIEALGAAMLDAGAAKQAVMVFQAASTLPNPPPVQTRIERELATAQRIAGPAPTVTPVPTATPAPVAEPLLVPGVLPTPEPVPSAIPVATPTPTPEPAPEPTLPPPPPPPALPDLPP